MLMGANDGGINEQLLKVGITGKRARHAFPDACVSPTREADVGAMPIAEFRRQVTLRYAGSHDPKDRLDEKTIVFRGAARIAGFALVAVCCARFYQSACGPARSIEKLCIACVKRWRCFQFLNQQKVRPSRLSNFLILSTN